MKRPKRTKSRGYGDYMVLRKIPGDSVGVLLYQFCHSTDGAFMLRLILIPYFVWNGKVRNRINILHIIFLKL